MPLVLVLAGLLATAAIAQTPAPESVKAELRTFITELNSAMATRDRAALERMFAPEFINVHTNGAPTDRATQIATALTSRGALPVPSLDGLIVVGDVAIVRDHVADRFGTAIYAKRNGRWQLLQMQGTALPSSLPAATNSADVLQRYAGRYRQDNGLFVNFAVEGTQLTLQVDGRPKFILTTVSQSEFAMPGDTARIRFAADGTYEFQRANQPMVKGVKQ